MLQIPRLREGKTLRVTEVREKPHILSPCLYCPHELLDLLLVLSLLRRYREGALPMVYLLYVSPQYDDVVITTPALEVREGGLREVSSSPKIAQPMSGRSESQTQVCGSLAP